MILKEQKQANYQALLKMLGKLEELIVCRLDLSNANTMMKRDIVRDFELQTTLEYTSKAHPELVQATDTGYALKMIAPESRNEGDSIHNILRLNKIEDIFGAKVTIGNAFLSLFPKEV